MHSRHIQPWICNHLGRLKLTHVDHGIPISVHEQDVRFARVVEATRKKPKQHDLAEEIARIKHKENLEREYVVSAKSRMLLSASP